MFRSFFLSRKWFLWSIVGSIALLFTTWFRVQLDIEITHWYGDFYDAIQRALSSPGSVPEQELFSFILTLGKISIVLVLTASLLEFFTKHYVFRWRTAMYDYYMKHWDRIRLIEGASQRIQEDTMRFAKIVEHLGIVLLRTIMTLIAFQPLLWQFSKEVNSLPFIGQVDHIVMYSAFASAILGTSLLAFVGMKLPGLEFNNQRAEAAFRKELVKSEDNEAFAQPPKMKALFSQVRSNYINMYKHYLYFDLAKWSYIQFASALPYLILVPAIFAGTITLGVFRQVLHLFSRYADSLNVLVYNWSDIVELMSIYKRLKAFEKDIESTKDTEYSIVNHS